MRRETIGCLLALLVGGRNGWGQQGGPRPDAAATPALRVSHAHLSDAREVRERLGLTREYDDVPGLDAVKVAVLDYGFEGVGLGRQYLPEGAVVVEHYDPEFVRQHRLGDPAYRKGFEPLNRHGRLMAQIVWAVTGSRPGGPKLYLLNANGPTMLRRAVRYAIEQRVDVILFSGSFEGGGNGDGRGPINRVVSEALAAGILWVNAAGNYGHRVYGGPVRLLPDGYLRLRDGSDVASLRFRNRLDENSVTVTLTWDDYREEEDAGTTKDLDLYVEDWTGRRVGAGTKTQVAGDRTPGPDESRNPRERVVLNDLPANPRVPTDPDYCYRIRVKAKAGRFGASDRLRVLVTGGHDVFVASGASTPEEALEFIDASGEGEIYPPADHPLVLTVGDAGPDSSVGPTADRRQKPDVIVDDSRAFFTDGQVTAGSSNAAAYVAGVVAVLRAAEPRLGAGHVLWIAREGPVSKAAQPPSIPGASRPDPRSRMGLRTWKTPTRAGLARLVRDGR